MSQEISPGGVLDYLAKQERYIRSQGWEPVGLTMNRNTMWAVMNSYWSFLSPDWNAVQVAIHGMSPSTHSFLLGLKVFLDGRMQDGDVLVLAAPAEQSRPQADRPTLVTPDLPPSDQTPDDSDQWFLEHASKEEIDLYELVRKQDMAWPLFEKEVLSGPWAMFVLKGGTPWMARRLLAAYMENQAFETQLREEKGED